MPDPASGFSRLCPSCGRRVPRSVAVCRCGTGVSAPVDDPAGPVSSKPGLSALNLAVGALLLGAVAGAGYWATRPAPAQPAAAAPTAGIVDGEAVSVSPQSSPLSAERRAWEAELARTNASKAVAAVPETTPLSTAATPANPAALEDIVGRVMPAVVLVETSTGRGSAFFVRPDTLITNVHVVKGDTVVQLRRMDGTTLSARVESRAPGFDIAILRVTPVAGQVVIPIGSAQTLRPGQEVITIGSALGTLQNSVSRGIVSGLRQAGDATLVQNDAAANPGNSGGPLLDRNGVAIGITTMGYRDQQGLNFAVAIDHARDILDGRVTDTGSGLLALQEVKPAGTARPSESERAQEQGQRVFLASVTRLARSADALDLDWRSFRQQCYSAALPASYSHEWFVLFTPRAVTPTQVGGACSTFLAAFQKEAVRLGAEMRGALDAARRAGVLPGAVREALRENRLEFDGWDR